MLIYVDDIIITSNNNATIDTIIKQLGSTFAIKVLGQLSYFLGIEIQRGFWHYSFPMKVHSWTSTKSRSIWIKTYPHSHCHHQPSSANHSPRFSDLVRYRQVMGAFQYVTLSILDINYAVNKVCQYMHASIKIHWFDIKQILRYLHGTTDHIW